MFKILSHLRVVLVTAVFGMRINFADTHMLVHLSRFKKLVGQAMMVVTHLEFSWCKMHKHNVQEKQSFGSFEGYEYNINTLSLCCDMYVTKQFGNFVVTILSLGYYDEHYAIKNFPCYCQEYVTRCNYDLYRLRNLFCVIMCHYGLHKGEIL